MSQHRTDRPVIGGPRATAGGRAWALRARGYNETRIAIRQARVAELYAAGRSFRRIGAELGISKSQAHRDLAAALAQLHDVDRGLEMAVARLVDGLSYRQVAARYGVSVAHAARWCRVGEQVLSRRLDTRRMH